MSSGLRRGSLGSRVQFLLKCLAESSRRPLPKKCPFPLAKYPHPPTIINVIIFCPLIPFSHHVWHRQTTTTLPHCLELHIGYFFLLTTFNGTNGSGKKAHEAISSFLDPKTS
ncbi:unnamed protein product [Macrosiphum euphorbiae]|uniref:Uncharacterized protein n=1 Tax=Macrosiphum euphorbiae TaxID=13131 RepID=A0AAV0VQN4_9HEMI|nr:unnamed protein product [Macrosiphum euphorbiae]